MQKISKRNKNRKEMHVTFSWISVGRRSDSIAEIVSSPQGTGDSVTRPRLRAVLP